MTKLWHNDVFAGSFAVISANCNIMLLCDGAPTDRADALTKALADVAMAPGDFSVGEGDPNGRKLIVGAKSSVVVDADGEGDHVALIDATRLLSLTELVTPKQVTIDDEVNFPVWEDTVADPT